MNGSVPIADGISVRTASHTDISAIQSIYAHHVLNGLASFEEEAPSVREMERRRSVAEKLGLPFLVAEDKNSIVGFAYAAPFRSRAAYRFTLEDSVYIAENGRRKGYGKLLLSAVLEQCTGLGYRQIVAVIGDSANTASIRLHEQAGFHHAGTVKAAGWKFGRWVDSVTMQRALGDGDKTDPE
jgi:L-amino acid N-acyltransferase YncA